MCYQVNQDGASKHPLIALGNQRSEQGPAFKSNLPIVLRKYFSKGTSILDRTFKKIMKARPTYLKPEYFRRK
ncbi:hypothetical protein FE36_00525 [Xanthomonas oryzae pv. oryzicola]|nr:hypothetical protein FE36_00525 [Xanthomonas oryzae pv. oryzicola]AKO02363.1 hypothetical protein ACU15_19710 [Xanthomonas oryzae pv. oryzicola]KOR51820.1 hypothetical protein ADT27_02775 [Xanthomonas oryzae]